MVYHSNENEVIPSARRLIKSLRDMGYDFTTAVADLVDNSIEAGASVVAIDVEFDGDDSWVRIADNGKGLTPAQLREAMRYGAKREYAKEDLGKFGLGLKTASLSQCQRLSVASRTNPERADIAAYCWDIEHIEETNRWEILPLERNGLGPAIREPLKEKNGTVVLWQRLDRILGYKHPYGEKARKSLSALCRDVEEHLGMVFHRFLSNDLQRKKFRILLNGNPIQPWDPFARNEKRTQILTPVILPLKYEGASGEVRIEPYVLPHQNNFSSPDAFKQASGPSNWNQQQGFYIYRAGRLIQSGGWCRLRTSDEHTKLARIALSFSPVLDEAFKINVSKMRVQLPLQIRDQIEQSIRSVIKIAQDTYRKNLPRRSTAGSLGGQLNSVPGIQTASAHPATLRTDSSTSVSSLPVDSQRFWTLGEIRSHLEKLAKPDERPIIAELFKRLYTMLKIKEGN